MHADLAESGARLSKSFREGQALMGERIVEMMAASEAARRRLVEAEAATAAAEAARLAEGAAAAAEKLRLGQERERERALMAQRITMLQQRVRDRQEAVRCARDQMTRLSAIWERTRLGQQVGHSPCERDGEREHCATMRGRAL